MEWRSVRWMYSTSRSQIQGRRSKHRDRDDDLGQRKQASPRDLRAAEDAATRPIIRHLDEDRRREPASRWTGLAAGGEDWWRPWASRFSVNSRRASPAAGSSHGRTKQHQLERHSRSGVTETASSCPRLISQAGGRVMSMSGNGRRSGGSRSGTRSHSPSRRQATSHLERPSAGLLTLGSIFASLENASRRPWRVGFSHEGAPRHFAALSASAKAILFPSRAGYASA